MKLREFCSIFSTRLNHSIFIKCFYLKAFWYKSIPSFVSFQTQHVFFLFPSCFPSQDCPLSSFGIATENQPNAFLWQSLFPLPWLSVAGEADPCRSVAGKCNLHWISLYKTKQSPHCPRKHVLSEHCEAFQQCLLKC